MNLQKVTLPLLVLDVEHNDQKQALAHVLNQHDSGYQQPFILNSGDDNYDVPAEDFHFRATRPDGQIIDVDNSNGDLVEKGDQNWLLNLPTGVTEAPGIVKCVIYAKDNGHVLASSQIIMYNIMPAFDLEDVSHVSYVPDLDKLKANLQDLVGKAQDQVTRLSGITAGDKQAAEQALKEELYKLGKQAGDWLDGEKTNINQKIADIVKQSSGLDEAYKQAYKEEIDKLAGQTSTDYEAKLQAVIDKLNADKQASLQAITDDWTKQKGSLQSDFASFKDDLASQVKSITDSVNALNTTDLPAVQEKVKEFSDTLDKLNSQISAIKLDYYTKDEIDGKLDALKSGATPDLTDLKKQVSDNTTALQSKVGKDELADYAKKTDLPTVPDLTGYATAKQLTDGLSLKADKTALDSYALKSDIPAIPDLSDYAKTSALQDYASKTALDSYVLKTDLASYAKKTDIPSIPDLSKYALKTDIKNVDLTGYLTKDNADETYAKKNDLPDISGLETQANHKADIDKLNESIGTKADKTALDSYALKSELPAMPDLSAYAKVTALENYATKQALDAYALKTDLPDLTSYAKKTDLPAPVDLTGYAKKADLPDVSGLETQADHANDVKKINETLETYAKKSELPSTDGLETKADHKADVDKLNEALDNKADKTALADYALKTDVPAAPDLTGYAKKSDLPTVPSLDGYAKTEDVDKKLDTKANNTDLAAYETSANHKADIDKLNKALEGKADVSAIPALPDMSQYALKTDLKNVDLTGYLTKSDADRLLGEKANESELADYAKKTDLPPVPNLTVYAKVTDVAKALNNKADKDDLKEYAKTADVEQVNTTATNADEIANIAMQNSQSAVYEIQVDGGHVLPKEHGYVNLPLGLSSYLKKADANNEYAKKTDIPDASQFATKEDLASASDYYANVPDGAVAHANVYRNKVINLSDADTKAQIKQAIKDETFRNIFPGDIWEINNRRYYVADINAENYGPTSKDVDNKQYPGTRTYRPTVSLLTIIPKPDGAGDYWAPVMDNSNDLSNKGVAGSDIQASITSLTNNVKQDFDNNLLYFNSELSDKINSDGTFHIARPNISYEPEWNYCQLSALPSEIMVTGNSRFALKPDHIDFNVYFVTGKQMAIAKLNTNFTRMMLDNETKHGQVQSDWTDYPGGITLQDLSSKNTNLTMNEYGNIGENSINHKAHGAFVYYIIYDL